jgi:hypothetical protein
MLIITIIDIGAGVLTLLGGLYALAARDIDEQYAGAVMLIAAGAAQVVAAGVNWVAGANGPLFVAVVWAALALLFGWLAWSRASEMDEAARADTEGDLW